MNQKTRRLAETAVMLAVAVILSLPMLKFKGLWAMGGSVSFGRFVPIIIIGYKYGPKWGAFTGFALSVLNLLISGFAELLSYGVSWQAVTASVILEYLFASALIGYAAGLCSKWSKKSVSVSLATGAVLGLFLRFLCLFVAGIIIWGYWTGGQKDTFLATVIYSFVYNISYMLPETIIAAVECFVLASIPAVKKLIQAK
ncbi:MAG: ECF transporter S component [Bacillota bacterium]|nr:ECF transporter S component [Bacillota bacterium]